VQLDVGSRVPIATTAMGRAYIWALPRKNVPLCCANCATITAARWSRMRTARACRGDGGASRLHDLAGEWQDDVAASAWRLKLNDGTGPYAFNCGGTGIPLYGRSPGHDIGPRLVAM